jgi:hypothetical protein
LFFREVIDKVKRRGNGLFLAFNEKKQVDCNFSYNNSNLMMLEDWKRFLDLLVDW